MRYSGVLRSFKGVRTPGLQYVRSVNQRQLGEMQTRRTWWSPPRSGPSPHPHNHSCHHLTGGASSSAFALSAARALSLSSSKLGCLDDATDGGGIGSGGLLASGVPTRGGGARGAGRSSGCGGGGGCDFLFFPPGLFLEAGANDDDACNVGRCGTSRFFAFPDPESSSGTVSDSVMIAECAGMFSDVRDAFGVSNGLCGSGVGGPGDGEGENCSTEGVSRSSSGTASASVSVSLSVVESC